MRVSMTFLLTAAIGIAGCQVEATEAESGSLRAAAEAIAAPNGVPHDGGAPAQRDGAPTASPASRDVPDGYRVMKPILRTGNFGHAVLLLDAETQTFVPIFIGGTEALSIQLRLAGEEFSRPLTHDLFDRFARKLDAKMVRAQVDRIVDGVYIGTVVFERAIPGSATLGGDSPEVFSLDARTSDAIALAIGNGVPILVADTVFEEAGLEADDLGDDGAPAGARPKDPVAL